MREVMAEGGESTKGAVISDDNMTILDSNDGEENGVIIKTHNILQQSPIESLLGPLKGIMPIEINAGIGLEKNVHGLADRKPDNLSKKFKMFG